VFKDESKLDIDYLPSRLPHREKEHRMLMGFFDFLLHCPERMAQRVLVTGDIGTGKTALCQRFGLDITSEAKRRTINLRYVHVNCRESRGSLFLILQHAIRGLYPNFPKRGISAEEALMALMQCLDEEEAFMIIALDEFDSLIEHEGSDAIYKLTRLQEIRAGKPHRASLIGILRNLSTIDRLDASTRSTLQHNIIRLDKYSHPQLVDILNDRVSMAFKSTTVPDDSVSLAAELAVLESGNARLAIELLWRAGKYADAENLGVVLPEYVRKAVSSIIPTRKSELASLELHERLFLLGLALTLKENQKAHATLREIEKTYAVICEEFNVRTRSHTQLWKYAKLLSAFGILKTTVSSNNEGGRSTNISMPSIPAGELEKELRALLEK
jgi:cell division control protein 6